MTAEQRRQARLNDELERRRKATPIIDGPMAMTFKRARLALDDAMHAGDLTYAARILSEAAWGLVRDDRVWTRVRPPLGRHARPEIEEAA